MNTTQPQLIMQRWHLVQHELLPELKAQVGPLTPKLEKVIHTLEWVRIEEFTAVSWCGVGRPPFERAWLANAFVAKAVLGLTTTVGLIERLMIDRALRRICGFPLHKTLPSEATFSRAFDEFAEGGLGQRVHEALIKEHLGDQLIGHLNRDGTAIEARERPYWKEGPAAGAAATPQAALLPKKERSAETSVPETPAPARKRGRPRRGEVRPAAKATAIKRQREQTLAQMLEEIPTACDRGTKCNAQGYTNSWSGYKLHVDTAEKRQTGEVRPEELAWDGRRRRGMRWRRGPSKRSCRSIRRPAKRCRPG
jgi:hypothetical protein